MFKFIDKKYGPPKRGFASDNASGIHPNILVAIEEANRGHVSAYGNDPYTEYAEAILKKHFGKNPDIYFSFNGTGANVVGLSSCLHSFEAVICSESAHINEHECGAAEKFIGCKLITISTKDGKLSLEQIKQKIQRVGDEHFVQPKVISITQLTELGTLYTLDEIRAIVEFAHAQNMLVHMDGARLANAVCALNSSFKQMTADAGIDVLSFGGTKNGLLCGEAVIVFNPAIKKNVKYLRKQAMQLASKMRFISAQFIAMFENNLWLKNAEHANHMAQLLKQHLSKIPGIKISQTVQANILHATMPAEIIKPLQKHYDFYIRDYANNLVRLVTSFDTTKDDVEDFAKRVAEMI